MSHLFIYLFMVDALCRYSVRNRFDIASIRTNQLVIGLIVRHFVDRQHTKNIIGFAVSHCRRFTLSKNSANHALLAVKSVTIFNSINY